LISGIYFTTSGMNVDQKRMEILSNNLANINSVGFKKRSIIFVNYKDMLVSTLNKDTTLGSLSKGLIIEGFSVDMSNGPLKFTQNPLDLAVNDYNFFVVEDASGNELLTKNGSFALDSENCLINSDGYRVLGEKGPVKIESPETLSIDSQGNIAAGNQAVGKLKIITINNQEDLVITDSSYYMLKNGAEPAGEKEIIVMQGFLETSNVNGVSEMAEMIEVMRSYEINQKIIKMQDETLSKAVNNVGRPA